MLDKSPTDRSYDEVSPKEQVAHPDPQINLPQLLNTMRREGSGRKHTLGTLVGNGDSNG
jgi:hypothetical protein